MKKQSCLFSKIIAALLVLGVLLTSLPFSALAGSGLDVYQNGSKRTSLVLGFSDRIQMQFSVTKPVKSVGYVIAANDTGKKVEISLYAWNGDPRTSRKGEPIRRQLLEKWDRNSVIGFDFGSDPLPAGEYLFEARAVEGESIKFSWFSDPIAGVQGYRDDFYYEGVPEGVIAFADGSSDGFGTVHVTKVSPSLTVPEESVIAEDSPIAVLNVDSDQWHYVDGLGRTGSEYAETGDANGKKVGIFYWTWHNHSANGTPQNLEQIMREHPEAKNDYKNAVWSKFTGAFFWDEPLFGYYTELDSYVLRKHAELLADAGIDFVLFDCTNESLTFEREYVNLLEVWSQARKDGVKTPQIGFMLPFWDQKATANSLRQIYSRVYRDGNYQDLWFYWEGKPLVMGIKESLDPADPVEKEISEFFTFRRGEPSYWLEDQKDDSWGWLHVYPQALYKNADGTVEMTTVGIAQNADSVSRKLTAMNAENVMGRSYSENKNYKYTYTYRGREIVCNSSMENSSYYGINFQEQWDFAMTVDPELVFVTGWNEWIVGRFEKWEGVENAFPDQYRDEYSRDIEPSRGDLKDYYYYQLVDNVRKFKGMSRPQYQPGTKTIDIAGSPDQWNDESIVTNNTYRNNTYQRDCKGFGKTKYQNPGIRNDFVTAKCCQDDEFLYFYVETDKDITSYTDENWMRLLLDTGEATADSKDWEEFEFIVGRETGTPETLTLEKSTGGWNWEKVADAEYTVQGSVLQLKLRKADLGIEGNEFTFYYKWADANLEEGDILTLYTDGDAAPGGRFTFAFRGEEAPEPPKKKGCSGFVSLYGVGAVLTAALILLKKKENES